MSVFYPLVALKDNDETALLNTRGRKNNFVVPVLGLFNKIQLEIEPESNYREFK